MKKGNILGKYGILPLKLFIFLFSSIHGAGRTAIEYLAELTEYDALAVADRYSVDTAQGCL